MLQKISFFFFRELHLIKVLLIIRDSYMSWSKRFTFLKLCVGFSIFVSVSFLSRFTFFVKIFLLVFCYCSWDSLTSKHHNSFLNKNNRIATHSFASRPLIFKLLQEVLKFNDICVSWSSTKTNLEANFLNSQNRNFENVSFFR